MLYFDKNKQKYILFPHKVIYTDISTPKGETLENWALPDKQWWIDTAAKHDDIKIIEFYDIEVTEEMNERFKEIETFARIDLATAYILGEELPDFITDYLLGKVETIDQTKLDEYYEIH
jgi:hypothetical protein